MRPGPWRPAWLARTSCNCFANGSCGNVCDMPGPYVKVKDEKGCPYYEGGPGCCNCPPDGDDGDGGDDEDAGIPDGDEDAGDDQHRQQTRAGAPPPSRHERAEHDECSGYARPSRGPRPWCRSSASTSPPSSSLQRLDGCQQEHVGDRRVEIAAPLADRDRAQPVHAATSTSRSVNSRKTCSSVLRSWMLNAPL